MTSLTVPPPSLANQAAAVGRSSEIDPTLGSLSLVGTLQPPQPILRAFCPSLRGTSLGPGPAGKLGMLAAPWPPCQLGIQNPLRNWPLQSAYRGWSPGCRVKAIRKGPESCASQGLGSPQHTTTAQAGSRFPSLHPASPWKPLLLHRK